MCPQPLPITQQILKLKLRIGNFNFRIFDQKSFCKKPRLDSIEMNGREIVYGIAFAIVY